MQEFAGVHFRPTGGVSGIHMSEDYFVQGGGIELKIGRMIGRAGATIVYKDMCVHLSECMYARHVKGTNVWALFYWKCHAFTGTGVLFFCRGVLLG